MYELKALGECTYYIDCPSKIGIIRKEKEVILVDGGSSKDSAKKTLKAVSDEGWTVKSIIITHSHADHIGGVKYLADNTGARVYAKGAECDFTRHTYLEGAYIWGGFPHKDLRSHFFLAPPCGVLSIEEFEEEGVSIIDLPGHSFDQIGVKVSDGTVFVADALASEATLEKYGVSFLYDVKSYLETLEKLKTLDGKVFLPSHNEPQRSITNLAEKNVEKTLEICECIVELLDTPLTFDELLKGVFDRYSLILSTGQYSLVGATLRSYVSYLWDEGRIEPVIDDNLMKWKGTVKRLGLPLF
ncbi:MAG: MBL fold metallo-hydrolase [Clostridia bacterium]|nr:MBL fold metallo-hydrolase [Clostridia bacterium]